MLVYYGDVHDTELDHNSVYEFLKKALTKPPEEAPYRGPAELIEGDWEYKNKWEGKLERYAGEEVILLSGKEVYSAWYAGGLVDQR